METRRFAEYDVSRLMLGTVQFGMPYGVANRTGQPDLQQVREILRVALDGGVNCFDTAAAYGTSEDVLGSALRELGVLDKVMVVTKVRALTQDELETPARAEEAITASVAASRRRLQLDCLPLVLFHREADARYLHVLQNLKEKGWLRHAGVSCDNAPGPAVEFAANPDVAAMQIPANILDRRHADSGAFRAASETGTAVFIRSVFLQGVIVMPEARIPQHLRDILPVRRRLAELAGDAGIDLAELAVRYMLGQSGVTCVLAGVETVEQIQENVVLFDKGPLPPDVQDAVEAAVPTLPAPLMTPATWPEAEAS